MLHKQQTNSYIVKCYNYKEGGIIIKEINKIAKRIGEVHVLKELTLGEYYNLKPDESFKIYNDDGTLASESMVGYLLDNEKSGQPWFVSKAYFNENYVFTDDKTKEDIIKWSITAINEINEVLGNKDKYEGKQLSSDEQLKERISNYELLILTILGKSTSKKEIKQLKQWIENSINGIERNILSNKELLNSRETLKERQDYFGSALTLLN